MGSVLTAKNRDTEEKTREERSRSMSKEVVGCVQFLVWNNNLLIQFEYGKKKDISYCFLVNVCSKEEVCLEVDEPISILPQKEQGQFLTIYGYTDVEEPCMFERGVYFYFFYCLCYVKAISINMLEGHVSGERDPYLNEEEDIGM